MQQSATSRKACPTPAMPTIQGKRRNRMTPRMFWSVGRYTPIMVPRLACRGAGSVGVWLYKRGFRFTFFFFFLERLVMVLGWTGS